MSKPESTNYNSTNRLYLLRHGENPANITKVFSNHLVDQPLTEKGVLQAEQTADYFAGQGLDAIYSSPLKRAAQTAGIIASRLGLKATILEAFREINVGLLEGRPATPADWAFHTQMMHAWFDGQHEAAFPEGENYHDLWARMNDGLLAATEGRSGQKILVVGHGGIMSITLKDLCPDLDVDWLRTTLWDNCAFTEVDLSRQDGRLRGRLLSWNQHHHLHGAAADLVPGVPQDEGPEATPEK
ncbi:MAG: histidine phosphatase family protein [Chloroflexota bacterium]|jgi:probable phosphoglycerate mutase